MVINILGSGTSTGVPEVGCCCEVCTSRDKRDERLRCSGLVDIDGVRILIDCGPDFRLQMMRLNDFKAIDGVLVSHEHYDHVGGLDDLRPYTRLRDLPIYAEDYTAERIMKRIPYCFVENLYPGVPKLELIKITTDKEFQVENSNGNCVTVTPIRVMHGKLPIVGYRIGKMAWITDMLTMPEEEYEKLKDLDCLIINALRIKPHNTHQNLEQAIESAQRIGAKQTYFVHMSHQMGLHKKIDDLLPEGINLAYDGLVINI